MIKLIFISCFFAILFIVEQSFFPQTHTILSGMPLMSVFGTFAFFVISRKFGILWLLAYALAYDSYKIQFLPIAFVLYCIYCGIIYFLSVKFFTSKNFYSTISFAAIAGVFNGFAGMLMERQFNVKFFAIQFAVFTLLFFALSVFSKTLSGFIFKRFRYGIS
ncbi:MAG: hypothetical protein ACD_76C00106G0033 [uncultured bacterium]|nr:MAG: hypothetical protein ACD_76C00106G0033 [uncultured bacterium]